MRSFRIAFLAAVALACTATLARGQEEMQQRSIRFGHVQSTYHPVSAGVKKFAEVLAARSGARLTVQEYPNGIYGSEAQQADALQDGRIEILASATTSLVGIAKELGLIDLPFLVLNRAQAFALVDGPLGDALRARLPDKGLVALAFWDLGFRYVTNNKRPIHTVEDLKGLKLEVRPDPVTVSTLRALGAQPVPLTFMEYINGGGSDTDGKGDMSLAAVKFYKAQKYASVIGHVYGASIVLVSKRFWDKLSPTEQKILQESAIEARDYQRTVSQATTDATRKELQTRGMQVNQVTLAEGRRMQAIAKPLRDTYLSEYDPEIQALYRSELERIKGLQ